MLTTGAPPNILIRANIYNNDPIRYIVLVVSCFVLPIPNIYRDTSVLIPSLIRLESVVRLSSCLRVIYLRTSPTSGEENSLIFPGRDMSVIWGEEDQNHGPGIVNQNQVPVLCPQNVNQNQVPPRTSYSTSILWRAAICYFIPAQEWCWGTRNLSDPGYFIGSCKTQPGSLRMASFSKLRVP